MTRLLLQQAHTHAGTAYRAGARIDVEASTADWLIARGVATVDVPPPTVVPESAEALPKPSLRKEPKP